MVKINNVFGDVKVGKQGEAVYQRHYGEQTRRMVSPKRAIASEAQEKHRQLYRAALDWRKGLSLANRRYLDGYCIANGVVDNQKIPLPWSRFALKIYLQAVRFVPMLETTIVAGKEAEKKDYSVFDYYNTKNYWATSWGGETFRPSEDYPIGKVVLPLARTGNPGTLYVGLRLATTGHQPIGDDLVTAEIDGNTLHIRPGHEDREIQMPAYQLLADQPYALIVRVPDSGGANYISWWHNPNTKTYPRGRRIHSSDSGASWSYSAYTHNFEVWTAGEADIKKREGLLHVRHPALLSVVHERNGETVNGYDKLSSLDEEYLTGQVGLDVEGGDAIKVTTLPGIEYTYQVR